MAASIAASAGKVRRPELLNKIDVDVNINDAILLTRDEGAVTALDDKSLRIWLRRQTGKYWPSVSYTLESSPVVLFYHEPSRRLFCGCESGLVHEFIVADDFNRITSQCVYLGHQSRINALYFSHSHNLLLSACRDKKLNWYSTDPVDDNHQYIRGTYALPSMGMSIAMNESSRECYVGDSNGALHFISIDTNYRSKLNPSLSCHTGSIPILLWDSTTTWLFSGSYDASVVVLQGDKQQGIAVELNGHMDRLVGVSYDSLRKLLLTCSADGRIGVWPMDVKRSETAKWLDGDSCQICRHPFFWNISEMWTRKMIGLRQHHCRKCGHAVCDSCSQTRKALPLLGYEIVQRICDECVRTLQNDETIPLASFYEMSQGTIKMDYSQNKKVMMTVATDRTMKIWDMSSVV